MNRAPDQSPVTVGGTGTLSVTLQPGSYSLYCPVPGHREKGEAITLVIKPASAPAPTSTVLPTTTS